MQSAAKKEGDLENLLERKEFKGHGVSIAHILKIWIKDPAEIGKLPVETVLRPIVEYFDHAPGVQEHKDGRVISEKDVRGHLLDERVRTNLEPCITKVLQSLNYSPKELYLLEREDIRRLEVAIMAVREHFHVSIPAPARMAPEVDGNLKGVIRRL